MLVIMINVGMFCVQAPSKYRRSPREIQSYAMQSCEKRNKEKSLHYSSKPYTPTDPLIGLDLVIGKGLAKMSRLVRPKQKDEQKA